MKKIYEAPVSELIRVCEDDILTLSEGTDIKVVDFSQLID